MPFYRCLFVNCKAAIPRYSIRKFMLRHYLWKHTRIQLMEMSKQLGISNNPYFETTWILAHQLTDESEVMYS